ncbi:MAG: hypothetical protein KDA28_04435, partial [Phycisphaerales bacterium]|nr:hypothetical protein [Phycisphaerales bacterium]
SPDAALAHARTRFEGHASGSDVRGSYRQDIELVHGRNRVVHWAHTTDRIPIAVTEASPCLLDLEALEAPVVRSGAVDLRVRVERAPGFDGPIQLDVPYLAPGVQAQRGVSIAKGATEATIRVNIQGNATLGDWPILVTGRFDAGAGPIDIATTFRTMRIRAPFCVFRGTDADVEQGGTSSMTIDVTRLEGFEGSASVRLVGLPHGVAAADLTLDATTDVLVFEVQASADAPAGLHKGITCVATFETASGTVTHVLGGANLRVQRPPPPSVESPKAPPPKVETPDAPKERPPTRLEKLRREHAARREGGG